MYTTYKKETSPLSIDVESDTLPVYKAQTTLARGTTMLTDNLIWDYQDIAGLDHEASPQNVQQES